MATNEFLPFAAAGGANVLSQADWQALAARLSGYVSGVAKSEQINKGLRQSAAMAAMIGQFINTYGALDALDNADIAALMANFASTYRAQKTNYVTLVSGAANALTITLNPAPVDNAALAGAPLRLLIAATNTGAATLAANSLTALPIQRFDGQPLQRGDLPAGSVVALIPTGTTYRLAGIIYSEFRKRLSANLTVYVRSDGNDNNDGSANTAAAAFQTLQGALNRVAQIYDTAGYTITVQVGLIGVYVGAVVPSAIGTVIIQGSSASAASYTFTTPAGAAAPIVVAGGFVRAKGFKLRATAASGTPSSCAQCQGGTLIVEDCYLDATVQSTTHDHLLVGTGGRLITSGFIELLQSARSFVQSGGGGSFGSGAAGAATTIYLSSAAFSAAFCTVSSGYAEWSNTTFLGSATGSRYLAAANGTIQTYGGGANYLPGSTAGSEVTGGRYV